MPVSDLWQKTPSPSFGFSSLSPIQTQQKVDFVYQMGSNPLVLGSARYYLVESAPEFILNESAPVHLDSLVLYYLETFDNP